MAGFSSYVNVLFINIFHFRISYIHKVYKKAHLDGVSRFKIQNK